jgi:catechol 2,3-dioxygenase-like lactoylglutathione lyase family enzyme
VFNGRFLLDVVTDGGQPWRVKFTNIDHVTVIITDPERAVAFYRDTLGLPEVSSPSTFDGAGLNVRWFKAGPQYVHLFIAAEADVPGRRHFALGVENAAAARQYLTDRDVVIRETTPIPGAERFFIADPDGNRIEIIEWKDRSEIREVSSRAVS